MKNILFAACTAALALGGCATDGYGYGGGAVGFNAYYDDFYGPYHTGYWGRDGAFWYSDGPHGHWHRDTGGHFQRAPGQGNFHGVHAGHGGFWRRH